MSYIQQFLGQHLTSYYASVLLSSASSSSFTDFTNSNNIFKLTLETLIYAMKGNKAANGRWLIDLVNGEMIISY